MHLIEMELYGFKSFAKRTRIQFSEDITAIVGPNGSGKSNIVDAIMWTLGESSAKQLRGHKMEDVIFSGTDRHRGVNYAEVVLVFDNKDGFFDLPYEEISISRKYFRSGESQYAINKKRVRQKDVREIFLDTGIGKNGYSFIGQGQIDEILSTRPQDRRHAFEEAAGISKYKLKKDETLRNLAKTTDHIDRIDDIYLELLNRSDEMKDRREKAMKLAELNRFDRLYSYNLAMREVELFKQKREDLAQKSKILKSARDEKRKILKEKEAKIGSLETALEDSSDKESALRDSAVEWVREKERLSGAIRLKEEQKENLNRRLKALENRIEEFDGAIRRIEEGRRPLSEELKELEEHYREKTLAIEGLESSYDEVKKEAKRRDLSIRTRREETERLVDRRNAADSRRQALEYLIEEKEERLDQLRERRSQLEKEQRELKASVASYIEKKENIRVQIEKSGEELGAFQEKLNHLLEEIKHLDEAEIPQKGRIDSIARERDYLRRLRDNHEGFQYAVKQFLKGYSKENFASKVIGPVADAFQIDEEYTLAVSTALGYSGQNIILEDDASIQRILAYVKQKKMGRITFLPISNLRPRRVEDGLWNRSKIPFKIASDCVSCDDRLRVVAEHLLGRILLVDHAEAGRQLSKDLDYRYRIVTREGDVFQSGGAITGGQAKNDASELYNREAGIEAKTEALIQAQHALKSLQEERQTKKERADLWKANFEKADTNHRVLADEASKVENTLRQLEDAQVRLKTQISALIREVERESDSLQKDRLECDEKRQEIEAIDASMGDLSGDDDEKMTSLREKIESLRDALAEEKLAKQNLNGAIREGELRREQLQENADSLDRRRKEAVGEIDEILEDLKNIDEKLKRDIPEMDRAEKEQKRIGETLKALQTAHVSERETLKALKEEAEALREQLFSDEKEYVTITNRLQTAQSSYRESLDRLEAMEEPEEKEDLSKDSIQTMRQKKEKIRREIDRIGPVDGDALEQYDAWNARVMFLSEQREDLLLSKKKLEAMIKQLDKTMREQLDQALVRINVYFDEIFKELFQGGEASLTWETGDILEAGVLISARPPGKKLQSLSLLSGGERSMTAVALLFALLKMRRSPFCIVDEIDAALDDANIFRYSKYVKNIEDMQFIMITHRKQTMEMANEIYGVTMEEKGISRVLFLELEEVEKHVGMDQEEIQ